MICQTQKCTLLLSDFSQKSSVFRVINHWKGRRAASFHCLCCFFFFLNTLSQLSQCLLWIFYLSSTVMDLLMSTKQGAISCTSSVCCSLFPNPRFQSSRTHKTVAIESRLDQTSMISQKVHDKCNSNSDFEVCFHQLNKNINESRTRHGQKHLLKPKQCTLLHLCNDSDKLRNTLITKCWKLEPYTKIQMPCIAVAP